MEKFTSVRLNSIQALCAILLLVLTVTYLPVPQTAYPWLKFASMALAALIAVLGNACRSNTSITDSVLFFTAFACVSAAVQIAIWALCGEYVCYGYIDVMWISPALMGMIFFALKGNSDNFTFFLFKSLLLGSGLLIPFVILKVLGGLDKLLF